MPNIMCLGCGCTLDIGMDAETTEETRHCPACWSAKTIKPFVLTETDHHANPWTVIIKGKVLVERNADPEEPGMTNLRYTLYPGACLMLARSANTDEGYSAEQIRVSQNGDVWEIEVDTDGRDCDGRVSTHRDGVSEGGDPIEGQAWSPVNWDEGSQRDYSAEAAGY